MGHLIYVLSFASLLMIMNGETWGLSFTVEPQDEVMAVGQPLLLNCIADDGGSGTVVITWKKNQQWLLNLNGKNYQYLHNNSLYFQTIKAEDMGEYQCGAVIDGTSNIIYSRTARVAQAYIEATFVTPPSGATARVGDVNVHFTCVSGNSVPRASVYWEKDGQRFTGGEVSTLLIPSSNWTSSSLLIRNVQFAHVGAYRCVAVNPLLPSELKRSTEASLTVLPAQDQPHFLVQPTNKVATENQPTLLKCIVVGIPAPLVSWTCNSIAVQNTSQRYMFANGSLYFPAMNRTMAGEYTCSGVNSHGSVTSQPVLLTVAYFDFVFLESPTNKTAKVGESVSLSCVPPHSYPAAVTIHWYRNYQQIQPQAGAFAISSSGALTITSIRKSDEGKYFCDGTNSVLQQSRTSDVAYVTVNVPPSFAVKPVNTSVVQLETLLLHCQAAGSPMPMLLWQKDGMPVNSSRVTVHPNGSLSIPSTQVQDSGTFSCEAENVAGKTIASAYVVIYVPPSVVQHPTNATRTVGESVRFDCTFSGIPKPTISWFHAVGDSQTPVSGSSNYVLSDGQLEIRQVTKRNERKYLCQATNVAGSAGSSAFLKVQVPVSLDTHPVNVTVNQSSSASFHCSASGDPKPAVAWYKSDRQLSHGGRVVVTADTLTILNTSLADSGKYSCNVSNGLASHAGTAYLIVHVTPKITSFQVPSLVKMSSNATLSCTATGIPTPIISWQKDGILLSQQGSVPVTAGVTALINVQGADSGTYTCTAVNIVGQATAGGYLTAQVPPSKPISLSALPLSSTSVLMSWQPGFDGHSPLTGYKLAWKAANSPVTIVDNITKTTYTVRSLEPYTMYSFNVSGKNVIGYGEAAGVYNRTLEGSPSAPLIVETNVVNATAVRFRWEKPEKQNGIIMRYAIEYHVVGESHVTRMVLAANEVAGLVAVIGNLRPYTEYMFRIQAATGGKVVHWGNYTEYANTWTGESAPSAAPRDVQLTPLAADKILVEFKPVPSGSENGIIRSYDIHFVALGPVHFTNVTMVTIRGNSTLQHTLRGLHPWTWYNISVSAFTVQQGPISDWRRLRTPEAAPSQPPVSVRLASDEERSILVNITPPAAQFRNGALKGYIVYYSAASSGAPVIHNVTTVNTVTRLNSLMVYTVYTVRVSAFTSAGKGPKTDAKQIFTQEAVPGEIQSLAANTTSHNTVTVMWQAPKEPHGRLTKYTLYYNSSREGPSGTISVEASEVQTELRDLNGNTTFYIWIWAHTGKGPGPKVGPVIVTTGPAPVPTSQSPPPTTLPPTEPNITFSTVASPGNTEASTGFLTAREQIIVIACSAIIVFLLLIIIIYFVVIRSRTQQQTSLTGKGRSGASVMELGACSPDRQAVLDLHESVAESVESESVTSWDSSLPDRLRGDSRATELSADTMASNELHPNNNYALFDVAHHGGKSPLVKLRNKRVSLESTDSFYDQPYSSVEELGGGFTSFTPSPLIEGSDQEDETGSETKAPAKGDHKSFTNELYKATQENPDGGAVDTDDETNAYVGGTLTEDGGLENKGYGLPISDADLPEPLGGSDRPFEEDVSIAPPSGFEDEATNAEETASGQDPELLYAKVDLSKKTSRHGNKDEEGNAEISEPVHVPTLVYDERTNL